MVPGSARDIHVILASRSRPYASARALAEVLHGARAPKVRAAARKHPSLRSASTLAAIRWRARRVWYVLYLMCRFWPPSETRTFLEPGGQICKGPRGRRLLRKAAGISERSNQHLRVRSRMARRRLARGKARRSRAAPSWAHDAGAARKARDAARRGGLQPGGLSCRTGPLRRIGLQDGHRTCKCWQHWPSGVSRPMTCASLARFQEYDKHDHIGSHLHLLFLT